MKELATIESIPLEDLREQVMDGLVRRFSSGSLSMEDYERRTAVAAKALSKAEVFSAVEGLPEESPRAMAAAASRAVAGESGWRVAERGETIPASQTAVAIFSGAERRGVWHAPRRFESFCLFGGADLDLRRAVVPPEGITISALAVFGGLDVIIPPDMRVEVSGMGIFGGFDHKQTDAPEDAPLVRIEGFALFGGVGIKIKR